MPLIRTEFSCPTCKQRTGGDGKPILKRILANAGELVCEGDGTHKWPSIDQFFAAGPTVDFQPEVYKGLPQENTAPLTLTLPVALKAALTDKFGQKLSATVTGILASLLEGEAMMIPKSDIDRITARLGAVPKNSGELFGLIFSKTCDVENLQAERDEAVKNLQAYQNFSPGRIVINLGPQLATAEGKAKDASLPTPIWVERQVINALESNWF